MTNVSAEWYDHFLPPRAAGTYIHDTVTREPDNIVSSFSTSGSDSAILEVEWLGESSDFGVFELVYYVISDVEDIDILGRITFTVYVDVPVIMPLTTLSSVCRLKLTGDSPSGGEITYTLISKDSTPNLLNLTGSSPQLADTIPVPGTDEVQVFVSPTVAGRPALAIETDSTDYDILLRTYWGANPVEFIIADDARPWIPFNQVQIPASSTWFVLRNNEATSKTFSIFLAY